jgi:hypothetical protein
MGNSNPLGIGDIITIHGKGSKEVRNGEGGIDLGKP